MLFHHKPLSLLARSFYTFVSYSKHNIIVLGYAAHIIRIAIESGVITS